MTDKSIQNQSNKLTEPEDFKTTPGMLVWLDAALRLMTDSVTKISNECKITRQTWYEWQHKPGFIDWFTNEWDRRIKIVRPQLDAVGLKYAKSGDFKFWEGMMKRAGGLSDQPQQQQNVQINISRGENEAS